MKKRGERERERERERAKEKASEIFFGVQKLYERLPYIHTNDHRTHEYP